MSNIKILLIIIISVIGFGLFAQIVPDDNFREEINDKLGQPANYEPTIEDLNSLTGGLFAGNANISCIEGAQYLTNLNRLDLYLNQIIDISVLSGLSNLTRLDLWCNQISDISSLSGLYNLWKLELYSNQINDITELSGLTNLMNLHLEHNQISDISSISELTNLTTLCLSDNQISDLIALSGLMNLNHLHFNENLISNVFPLSGLTNLSSLRFDYNQVINITALSSLTNLTYLRFNHNQISDISALSGLTNLNILHLESNQITDIFPLVENTGLGLEDWLYIKYLLYTNPISQEAIEVHIPILESRGFATLRYPLLANLNVACYPFPIRHADNVAYDSELSWQGAESGTTYEVYLGTSIDNLINIGEGQYISDSTFTISPELLPDTEYWWRVKSTTEGEELWSGMWHFTTGNYTAINNDTVELPKDTVLQPAYPNPFNPTTNICFEIVADEIGILSIYNIKGEIIKSKKFHSGLHTYQWNGDKYSSGIYFYKLETPSYSKVNKMLMLK